MRLPAAILALPRKRGTIAILFLVWAAWLACPYFGLGPDSYVRIHDNADSTLALRVSLRTASPPHLVSAWNPLLLSGLDQTPLINCGADVDGWLFSVLPGWLACGLIMFAQRFIAGYFTFRLARDRLRVGVPASVCAGIVYAIFSQNTINVDWAGPTLYDGLSLACLPLVLWGLDDASGWSSRRRLVVAAGLGLLLGLTSHYSGAVFVVLAVGFWLILRRRRSAREAVFVFAVFALAWVAAEAPAIWSSMLNAPQSNRAHWALRTMSLRAAMSRQYSYVRGIVHDNQVMAAAALLGFAATRFRNRPLLVALGASAAILLVVLASAFWLMGVRRYAGPLSGFQVDRFYLLAPFALIVSGALGLDALAAKLRGRLPSDGGRRGRLWAASLTLLVLLLLGPLASARVQLRIVHEMRAGSTYAAVFQRPELQHLAAGGAGASPYRVVTVYAPRVFAKPADSFWPFLFGPLPAYAWAYGLETVDGYVQMYPERYQRFWGCVTGRALEQDKTVSDNFWSWGNRVYLFIPDTGRPPPAVTDLADICNPDLLSLVNVRYLISPVRLTGVGLRLVSGDPRGKPWPLYIYENTRVLPRYFVVGSTRTFPDSPGLLAALGDASLGELSSVGFVEAQDSAVLGLGLPDSGASAGRARLLAYEADYVSLSVTARDRSALVCTMNYSPYWRAYVDGRDVAVIPVDCTFIGVAVPGGAHRVELRYELPYAWLLPG
ncbi:MAG: DUF6044 family protein [bacterium]